MHFIVYLDDIWFVSNYSHSMCEIKKITQSSKETFVRKHKGKLCRFEIDKDKNLVKIAHNEMHFLHSIENMNCGNGFILATLNC